MSELYLLLYFVHVPHNILQGHSHTKSLINPRLSFPASSSSALVSSLVKCLRTVADTYCPAVLETTFSDTLFPQLIQLFAIEEPSK